MPPPPSSDQTPRRAGSRRLYVLAVSLLTVLAPLLTLLLRQRIAASFNNRPLLILFMLPIILCSLIGGLWPGVLSTLIASALLAYYAIPPVGSFAIDAPHDLIQLLALVCCGVLVSLMSEHIRRREKRYRLLVENQTDMVVKIDPAGRLLYVSPSCCQALGRREGELLDGGFLSLVWRDDRPAASDALRGLADPPYGASLEHRAQTPRRPQMAGLADLSRVRRGRAGPGIRLRGTRHHGQEAGRGKAAAARGQARQCPEHGQGGALGDGHRQRRVHLLRQLVRPSSTPRPSAWAATPCPWRTAWSASCIRTTAAPSTWRPERRWRPRIPTTAGTSRCAACTPTEGEGRMAVKVFIAKDAGGRAVQAYGFVPGHHRARAGRGGAAAPGVPAAGDGAAGQDRRLGAGPGHRGAGC